MVKQTLMKQTQKIYKTILMMNMHVLKMKNELVLRLNILKTNNSSKTSIKIDTNPQNPSM